MYFNPRTGKYVPIPRGRGRGRLPLRLNVNRIPKNNRNLRQAPLRKRNPKKKNNNLVNRTMNYGLTNTTNIQTSMKDLGLNRISCRILVPSNAFDNQLCVMPIHPSFLGVRLSAMAKLFCQWKLNSVSITTASKVATTDTHTVLMAYLGRCTPLTRDTTVQYANLSSMNAIQGMAWNPLHMVLPPDNLFHPVIPIVSTDLPYTGYAIVNADDITDVVTLYVDIDVTFKEPYTGDELYGNYGAVTITLGQNGGQVDGGAGYGIVGFVIASTVPNVDVGEMVSCTSFTLVNTEYADNQVTHNGIRTSSVTQVADRGAIKIYCLLTN